MKTALLLIAHGSRQPEANADLHHVAGLLRDQETCAIVLPAFLELAEPNIIQGGQQCVEAGAERVVLLPYFLAAGTHVRRDLTEARDRLAKMFSDVHFLLAEPLGRHPLLLEIVRERFQEVQTPGERGA